MKNNHKLGVLLAILGMVAGILCLYFIAGTYNTVIHTHFNAGDWEESNTIRLVYAVLGWLGTASGMRTNSTPASVVMIQLQRLQDKLLLVKMKNMLSMTAS